MRPGDGRVDRVLDRVSGTWPLVGREQELGDVIGHLTRQQPLAVLLVGGAGVGKTRLAREVATTLAARGHAVETVAATESSSTIPLGAFAPLVPAPDERATDLTQLLGDVRRTLLGQSAGRRLLLHVDDAQHLDAASAVLVQQLAATGDAAVLLTARARTPLPDAVSSLVRNEHGVRFELGPLDEADAGDLLEHVLGGPVERGTRHRMWQLARGNALFLHELVLAGVVGGELAESEGTWRWRGAFGSGARLQEVVEERLARVSPEERSVLETVALGEPLGLDLLEELGAPIEAVDALERKELVEIRRDERRLQLWLAHPLYGEVLREATPVLHARRIHRQLQEVIEARGRRRSDDVLRLASWQLQAGDADPDLLSEASVRADGLFDFPLAERFARAAVDAGGGSAARKALAGALRAQARSEEAEEVWADLAAHDAASLDADSATARAINLFFGLGRTDEAGAVLDEALARASTAAERLDLLGQAATFSLYLGRPLEALATGMAVAGDPESTAEARIDAVVAAGPALAITGRTAEAVDLIDEQVPNAFVIPVTGTLLAGYLLAGRLVALTLGGRLQEAHDLAAITCDQAVAIGSHDGVAAMTAAMGQVELRQGCLDAAVRHLREATALLREQDRNRYLSWCQGALAAAYAQRGDRPAAETALEEAEAVRVPAIRLFEIELELGRAWTAAAAGDRRRAVEIAVAAADDAEASGQAAFAALALHDVARLGQPGQVADRLATLAAASDSALLDAFASHARAAADGDAAALDEVSAAFEGLGAVLLGAEASAEAAAAYRSAGGTGSAYASAATARRLLEVAGPAATPPLDLLDAPLPLTAREHEIALLAVDGLSSRDIAERLYLSVRTVDNHLYRAYTKLGVTGRVELAAVLAGGLSTEPDK